MSALLVESARPDLQARALALDSRLREARREQRRWNHRLATLLREMDDERLHELLGYATLTAYAEAVLDLHPRKTRDLLRLARSFDTLPAIASAMADGALDWTKARELLRVATPETEQAWVRHAVEAPSSRQLEADVSAAAFGELPPHVGQPARAPARQRVVFELEAAEAELLHQALAALRAQTGLSAEEFDRGAALAAMARRVLHDLREEDPDEAPTGEPFRIVLEHCPACARTTGLDADVTDTLADQARCDAEIVDLTEGPHRGRLARKVPPARRRAVLHRDRYRCAVPGCRCRLWLDVHHLHGFADGGDHGEANLVTLCPSHHRLLHDGTLALERRRDGRLVVEHADGRRLVAPHVGHGGEATAVGWPRAGGRRAPWRLASAGRPPRQEVGHAP